MKESAINKSAPSIGVAISYFAVILYAVPKGYIMEINQVEAVAMGSIVIANIVMELKVLFSWIGSFFNKEDKEEEK